MRQGLRQLFDALVALLVTIVVLTIAANVIAIIFLEGFAGVLPDDPTSYNLIDQLTGG